MEKVLAATLFQDKGGILLEDDLQTCPLKFEAVLRKGRQWKGALTRRLSHQLLVLNPEFDLQRKCFSAIPALEFFQRPGT